MALEESRTEQVPYEPHIGETRQYWRDIILGVNDGLVSMFLLVVGVVGGGLATGQILLTAIAGALAGAISMAAGEYLATKSQDEVLEAELELERVHLEHHREAELEQLGTFFSEMGLDEADIPTLVAAFDKSDEAMLNAMKSLEFGVVESERRSPYRAMAASGALFLVGSLPSVVPFALVDRPGIGLVWASAFALSGLFVVGVIKANVARINRIRSGLENMVIAGFGGVAAWGIGNAIGTTLL
ncbi:MAG: VIT1/CCC1 transporter family protein [Acidimicrobiia bacterium]|nr:VIT1/CCC1 transporter family protein [Acidimicrobiia bacterium]